LYVDDHAYLQAKADIGYQGVKHVKLRGRLSVLLGPLTNIIPLIGAAQIAFINPPHLELDFTGAANVADFSAIDGAVRGVILSIINSMATLPNRFLVTLDAKNDYFKTYLPPIGVMRITVEKASGFAEESTGKAKKLFAKLTRAAPDCYAKVELGAEPMWQTTTKDNTTNPSWNETHDFVVSDFFQCIKVHVFDKDVNGDDEVGLGVTTVEEILRNGGRQELALEAKGESSGGKVLIAAEYFKLEADGGKSFSSSSHSSDGCMSGIASVLIAGAYGIQGQREQLKPSVKVTWGSEHTFQTAIQTDAPGTDINNPSWNQNFRIPITAKSGSQSFHIALLNGEQEIGAVDVPFADVQNAPDMKIQDRFDVGGGQSVRASISLKGLGTADVQQMNLPRR
jgi:Ca2+-dependent lipid-binding protein